MGKVNKKGRRSDRRNVDELERLSLFYSTRRASTRAEKAKSRREPRFLVGTSFLRDFVRRLRGGFPLLPQTFATFRLGAAGLTRKLLHHVVEDRR